MVAVGASATLPRTQLQASFEEAQAQFHAFRTTAPGLAAALSGKPVQPERLQPEYYALPVADKGAVSLGNAAMGLWSEKAKPGSGAPWIRESSRLAEDDLGLQWLLVLLQLQNGTKDAFAQQARGLEAAMLSQGWNRLPEAASWLLVSARELDAANAHDKADMARIVASELDPVSPIPEWILAKRSLQQADLAGAYSHGHEVWERLLAYPENQQILAFNGLRILRYALALTCLLLLLSWVVRYWPFVCHGLAERLPRDSSLYLRYAVLALVPVALMIAGVGLVAMSFLAAIAVWKHARRYERLLMGFILLFVGLQPLMAGLETTISNRFDQAGTESVYQRAIREGASADLQDRIDRSLARATGADKALLTAAKGIQAGKQASYGQAQELIAEAHRYAPDEPRIRAALGNQLFLQGKYDSATRLYQGALQGDWSNGPLLFNLGQSIAWRGRTDSMAKLIAQAEPIARYRIDVIARQNSNAFQTLPPNRLVLPPEPSPGRMWRSIADDFLSRRWSIDRWDLQTGLLDIPPFAVLPLSVAAIVFLVWWGGRPEHRKVLFECRTCGRVMCRVCRKGIHCAQCFRRLSGIEEVDLRNQLLERIEHEADGRRKLLRLAMDLVLPGTGRVMGSPSAGAFLQVFLLAACLAYSLNLPNIISLYPVSTTLVGRELSIAVLVALYALGGVQLVRGLGKDAKSALKEA